MKVTRAEVKKFEVLSLSNGSMMVEPTYKAKPLEEGMTPVGVFTRMAIAQELEKLINGALRKKKMTDSCEPGKHKWRKGEA